MELEDHKFDEEKESAVINHLACRINNILKDMFFKTKDYICYHGIIFIIYMNFTPLRVKSVN